MIKLFRLVLFVLVITEMQILFCMESEKTALPELFEKISASIKGGALSSMQPIVDQSLMSPQAPLIKILYKKDPLSDSNCQEIKKNLGSLMLGGFQNTQGDKIIWSVDMTELIQSIKKIDSTKAEKKASDIFEKAEKKKSKNLSPNINNQEDNGVPLINPKNGFTPKNLEGKSITVEWGKTTLSKEDAKALITGLQKTTLTHQENSAYKLTIPKETKQATEKLAVEKILKKLSSGDDKIDLPDNKNTETNKPISDLVADLKEKYKKQKNFSEQACAQNNTKNATVKKLESTIENLKKEIEDSKNDLQKKEESVIKYLHENLIKESVSLKEKLGEAGSLCTKERMKEKISDSVKKLEKNNNELKTSNSQKNWTIFGLSLTSVVLGGIVTYQNMPLVRALFKQS